MSATTSLQGRPRTRTAIEALLPRRRTLRFTPARRGGLRNPGATSPCRRAAPVKARAAAAKRRVVAGSMSPMMAKGCHKVPWERKGRRAESSAPSAG
jgi:hypothetical protein